MTYRREAKSWAGAIARAVAAAGVAQAAARTGVSPSRLRQLTNPHRRDGAVLDVVVALDTAAARAGAGTPVFAEYRRRLIAAGALAPDGPARELAILRAALRRACAGLLALLPAPELEAVG